MDVEAATVADADADADAQFGHTLKVGSHGAAAIFLLQQMGYIRFNVSVHITAAAAMVPQVNGFGTHFVRLW